MLAQLMVFKDQLRSLLKLVCVVLAVELFPVGLKRVSALEFTYGSIISRETSLESLQVLMKTLILKPL